MQENDYAVTGQQQLDTAAAKVLRNTYTLLAATILFSAMTAGFAMAINAPYMGLWMLIPYIGFLVLTEKFKNSSLGLVFVFGLTGWLGFTIGPILNHYLATQGAEPIILSLGGTAAIFFALSGYVLVTKKDLSKWTGFLMTGMIIGFIAMIANIFLQISALGLAISCIFLFISSGLIMWQTSAIIHGGETNYISATVTLYVMLYNIFTILLSFIGMGSDD
ncbi:MAG: BAX inhibitor protein [Gammaproteobacteria bacterium]|nr:MAG: BAX inhibitor protein [Gammaproteobacteria bacterium]